MTQPRIRISNGLGSGSGSGQKGDPGDSAYRVALNNGFNGTEEEWLASLVGANGIDGIDGQNGADGAPGPKGDQGEPGQNGADGADGQDGANGDSAYTIAVNNGFSGTEQEWLASLHGADGATGPKGDKGDQGEPGIQGIQGLKGDTGATGPAGSDGQDGADGATGPAGPGIATGGTAGQILAKVDETDYNTYWIDNYANWTSLLKHEVKLGESISKGQAVYVSSADGTNMIVSKASNSGEVTSSKTMGLLESDGSTNAHVNVITEGLLAGLNTNGATAGDPVWLGTNGNLIYGLANKPVAPAHLVFIGIVTRANQNNGEIFIRTQNGFEVNELHDVLIGTGYSSTPADNDLLAYDSASGLWKNQTAAQAGIATTTQLDTKQATVTGAITSVVSSNLATNRALISDGSGKITNSSVTSTEIGYLGSLTGNIQTQINEKAGLLSPAITTATFNSADANVDPITISTSNGHGGTNYAGLIKLENANAGATNTKKFIRLNPTGNFEIVNDGYSNTILSLTDSGNLSIAGAYNGATIGDSGWIQITSFTNSYSSPTGIYYRKINNIVWIRGAVSGGTGNTSAFTLPSGYRPSTDWVNATQQYGTSGLTYFTVGTNGSCTPFANASWTNISFPVG